MKQTFYIEGISCMSCVAHLKAFYSEKEGVVEVEIEKESGRVTLLTDQKLSDIILKEGLAEKYNLKKENNPNASIAYHKGIALPIGSHIKDNDIENIVQAIKKFKDV